MITEYYQFEYGIRQISYHFVNNFVMLLNTIPECYQLNIGIRLTLYYFGIIFVIILHNTRLTPEYYQQFFQQD